MLSLTRKTDYALIAMAELDRRTPTMVSVRVMSQGLGLPLPVLTNILKQLTRSGLVISTRGPNGGYRLARDSDRITLNDLIDAVEGPMQFTRCCPTPIPDDEGKCELEDSCAVKAPVRRVHEGLQNFLNQVTLDQITRNTVSVGVGSASNATP